MSIKRKLIRNLFLTILLMLIYYYIYNNIEYLSLNIKILSLFSLSIKIFTIYNLVLSISLFLEDNKVE